MQTEERFIYLHSIAQIALRTHINHALAKAGAKVTLAQAGILFLLEARDMQKMSELGEAIRVDNSAMTRVIDRMEKNGLVERVVDPKNRRAIHIRLTAKGRVAEGKARRIIQSANEEIKSGFSQREIDAYRKVLEGILKKFGD